MLELANGDLTTPWKDLEVARTVSELALRDSPYGNVGSRCLNLSERLLFFSLIEYLIIDWKKSIGFFPPTL